jgi:hypothetical protein
LANIEAGRFRSIVLLRNIHPVLAKGTREDGAIFEGVFDELSFRNVCLWHRVGGERKLLGFLSGEVA